MKHDGHGHEAYQDDPEYTAPEMEPGHGEDIHPPVNEVDTLPSLSALTIGVAGGALAGEEIRENIEDELDATEPGPNAPRRR